jgi:uncharacterized membrane protein YdbT with pleckstrin-like domain
VAYVHSVLQPGETVKVIGRLHWIIYLRAFFVLAVGGAVIVYSRQPQTEPETARLLFFAGWTIVAAGGLLLFGAWFRRMMTELSVTTQRVVYKRGFIWRRTVEMNLDKVETVDVEQTIGGRLLGYGTVRIRGTGQGIEAMERVGSPTRLRTAITAG